MEAPLTNGYLDLIRGIEYVRPTLPSGGRWQPKTEAEINLMRQAEALDAACKSLLSEVDRLRAEQATTGEQAPYTDAKTAFMQTGTTPMGGRAELRIEGQQPLIGRYCGTGMRKDQSSGLMLLEPMLTFEWADTDQPAEATHAGPDPSHGGLTTHRGTRENCSGPDCGPTEDDTPTGQKYPCGIVVYCDRCGEEHRGDYIVTDDMTSEERLAVARTHLNDNEEWSCGGLLGDLCPDCASKRL
ncbi:hypothetical protein ABTZ57_01260 [Streptomyces sp. NPDC094048]|uniref:hypothetical protein n=1 Tax=unclassified Streptomyces TaxID=2593676 RepID=UPI00331C28A1